MTNHELNSALCSACSVVGGIAEMASWASEEVAVELARKFPGRHLLDLTLGEVLAVDMAMRDKHMTAGVRKLTPEVGANELFETARWNA